MLTNPLEILDIRALATGLVLAFALALGQWALQRFRKKPG